jgi:hypothetical protein
MHWLFLLSQIWLFLLVSEWLILLGSNRCGLLQLLISFYRCAKSLILNSGVKTYLKSIIRNTKYILTKINKLIIIALRDKFSENKNLQVLLELMNGYHMMWI